VQAPITLSGQQKVEPVLGRLPARYECSRQCFLTIPGGFGNLHVEWIEVAIADDEDLTDCRKILADYFEERGSKIPGDAQIARGVSQAVTEDRAERLAPR